MKRLDVGCGKTKRDGYIGIDIGDFGQEIIMDVEEKRLPFQDNEIDSIFSQHFLEHLNDPVKLLDEFWRIVKKDGFVEIIVPHKDNTRAYDVHHRRYFNEVSFDSLKDKWEILELVVNDRPDIYLKIKPIKNNVVF